MRGYIYILKSQEIPNYLKIGKTIKSPTIRCKEINRIRYLSLATWEVSYWRWTENCNIAECVIHNRLRKYNVRAKNYREVFWVDLDLAVDVVSVVCDIYPPKEDIALDRVFRIRKTLDKLAYLHIRNKGPLSDKIIEYKKILGEVDFYRWMKEIRYLL
jgi:hypothetical protein